MNPADTGAQSDAAQRDAVTFGEAEARVAHIIDAWRDDPRLVEASVEMGFSLATVRAGLEAELAAWREPLALAAVLGDGDGRADGRPLPGTVFIVAARTVPASTMRQILWARAIGARVLLKPASGQRALGLALTRPDPMCLLLPDAPETRAETIAAGIAAADTVVVLGGDDTVAAIRAETPESKGFVAYGHRFSGAIIADDEDDTILAALADDAAAWAHSGCLAPRLIWTVGDPLALAQRLAPHLRATADAMGPPPQSEAHARTMALTTAVMRGFPRVDAGPFTLCVEGPSPRPPTSPRRWIAIRPYDASELAALAPSLSTLAVGPRVPTPGGLDAAIRVTPPGTMQRPPLAWRQDGLHPIESQRLPQ